MPVTKLGCFTQDALDGLVQNAPANAATQTITGGLTVTGTLSGGSVIDNGVITGPLRVTETLTVDGATTLTGAVTASAVVGLAAAGFTMATIARTASADGTGTGTIASGPMLQHVTVTSDDANKIIILPGAVAGRIVILSVAAVGYELRSSTPASIGINGGTGAGAESAIPANTTAVLICESATTWKGFQQTIDGTLAKVEVAAAP